jgi:hypothetical protein
LRAENGTLLRQVIQHSQSTRKAIGGNLVDHFKFLLVMGPTELKKEIKARFEAWDTDKTGSLSRTEMMVIQNHTHTMMKRISA